MRSLSDRHEPEFAEARRQADATTPPLERLVQAEEAAILRDAIDRLPPRDARLLRLRHGIDGPGQTLEEVGNAEGMTRERVRQIVKRAEERLRTVLRVEFGVHAPVPQAETVLDFKPMDVEKEEFSDSISCSPRVAGLNVEGTQQSVPGSARDATVPALIQTPAQVEPIQPPQEINHRANGLASPRPVFGPQLGEREGAALLQLRRQAKGKGHSRPILATVDYCRLNCVGWVTARRELDKLVKKGLLEFVGGLGRDAQYRLPT